MQSVANTQNLHLFYSIALQTSCNPFANNPLCKDPITTLFNKVYKSYSYADSYFSAILIFYFIIKKCFFYFFVKKAELF